MSETWIIDKPIHGSNILYITTEDAEFGDEIAVIYSGNMEHAHLVKAAPKLYEACEKALELLAPFDDPELSLGLGEKALTPLRDALAEANGETE